MTMLIAPSGGGLPLIESFSPSSNNETIYTDNNWGQYSELAIECWFEIEEVSETYRTGLEFYIQTDSFVNCIAGGYSRYYTASGETVQEETNRLPLGTYASFNSVDDETINYFRFDLKRSPVNSEYGSLIANGIAISSYSGYQNRPMWGSCGLISYSDMYRLQFNTNITGREITTDSVINIYGKI